MCFSASFTIFVKNLCFMLRIIFSLLVVVGLVSCQANEEMHARLQSLGELVQSHPDSALQLIEQIPARALRTRHLRADHALLYAVALDKNYIDSDNDSLIARVEHYYRRRPATDSVRHLIHYQRGRIHQNGQQYFAAVSEYLAALDHLDTLRSPYRAGLIFSRLGEMYREQYNFENALRYFRRAYSAYERVNSRVALYYTSFDLGNVLRYLHQYIESEHWYVLSLQTAREYNDTYVVSYCLSNLLTLYYETGNRTSFDECYKQLCQIADYRPSVVVKMLLANNALEANNLQQAKAFLADVSLMDYSGNESLFYLMQFKLASAERDYERANYYQYCCINANDSLVRNVYSTSVVTAEKQFYAERSAFAEYRLRMRRVVDVVVALLITTLVAWLIHYYRRRIRRKEQEAFDYMVALLITTLVAWLIHYYRRRIRCKEQETFDYMVAVDQMQQRVLVAEQQEVAYKSMLAERFSGMDALCRAFFERNTPRQQQEQLFREVRNRLRALAEDPKMAAEMDAVINAVHNNLMVRLQEQLPKFSAGDIHFLRLIYAGFSAQVISLVFNDSVQNIYARKYRIKTRILRSDAPDKAEFVDVMS